MTQILLLYIYTNIAINFTAFLWHLLQLRFQVHFIRWASFSCFRTMQAVVMGCVCQSWIKKLLTYLLTYLYRLLTIV